MENRMTDTGVIGSRINNAAITVRPV